MIPFSVGKLVPATILLLAIAVLTGLPGAAGAHAVLTDSSPKDLALLAVAPREVVLRFSARIEKRVSRVTLTAGDGRKVVLPSLHRGRDGAGANLLVIPLPPLGPGDYRFEYRVLATDGHATPGLIRFTVQGDSRP
jgi:methionine-rich copper-binding protein CopC